MHGKRWWVVQFLSIVLCFFCAVLDQLFNTPFSFTLVYLGASIITTLLEHIDREERDARHARERDSAVEDAEDFVWNHTSKRGH